MKKSPPAIEDLGVLVLEPSEALPERAFHVSLDGVHFVASDSLLPLKLRVSQAPRSRRRRSRIPFPFLELQIPVIIASYLACLLLRV